MKSLIILAFVTFSGAIKINSQYYSSTLEHEFPGVIQEHKMISEDLIKCKEESVGMEHTTWTEVCTSELKRIRDVHNTVVNKTNIWMLEILELGITD